MQTDAAELRAETFTITQLVEEHACIPDNINYHRNILDLCLTSDPVNDD